MLGNGDVDPAAMDFDRDSSGMACDHIDVRDDVPEFLNDLQTFGGIELSRSDRHPLHNHGVGIGQVAPEFVIVLRHHDLGREQTGIASLHLPDPAQEVRLVG